MTYFPWSHTVYLPFLNDSSPCQWPCFGKSLSCKHLGYLQPLKIIIYRRQGDGCVVYTAFGFSVEGTWVLNMWACLWDAYLVVLHCFKKEFSLTTSPVFTQQDKNFLSSTVYYLHYFLHFLQNPTVMSYLCVWKSPCLQRAYWWKEEVPPAAS